MDVTPNCLRLDDHPEFCRLEHGIHVQNDEYYESLFLSRDGIFG
jgi:hypothetical protein